MDHRPRFAIKMDALQRMAMKNMLSQVLPLYIVTEYPKSGGTWVGQMLAHYFDVPFPRNCAPKLESCIMHCHSLYSPLMRNVFCVVRDGRDVMVSAYYHMFFHNEKNSPFLVERARKHNPFRDYEDVESNLPRVIEYLFTVENRKLFHFNWNEFIDSWVGRRHAVMVKYEHLLEDAAAALKGPIEQVTGRAPDLARLEGAKARFSFQAMAGRRAGTEVKGSFLRKGTAGDWKNKFSKEARELFHQYAGHNLIRLGYETDGSWVDA
ncbi:MAG: sulfotransferase domain-containing protein [Betaproteobacteria bacterium]|nr:sulfotransferase domain-containing protein [Betaproteobacteria bacterium]